MSISCLKLNYLFTVIPKTIINELLAGTVPLKNHLPELFQRKKENISGAFNYSRRLLHTHGCLTESLFELEVSKSLVVAMSAEKFTLDPDLLPVSISKKKM